MIPTAVEEIVRWATPVIHFRRTAVADCTIGGQDITPGDKVVLWYQSANRDEDGVRRPLRVRRRARSRTTTWASAAADRTSASGRQPGPPRDHGDAPGDLHAACPTSQITGEPDYLQSAFIHGIKRMPCEW